MLRPIRNALTRKQEQLVSQSSVSVLVKQAVQEYLRQNYPDALATVTVRYDPEQRLVTIATPSKALAGELTLNTRDIRAHLIAHQVKVGRIVAH